MLRVTRTWRGAPVEGLAPEKISDAVHDFVTRVEQALVADGVEAIGLDEKLAWFASMISHNAAAFNDMVVRAFEERVDEQLAVDNSFTALIHTEASKKRMGLT